MIIVVDYNMGNVGSVKNAIEFLGKEAVISRNKKDFVNASHIILPGVGAFGDGMANLKKFGLIEILNEEVFENKKPFLGICLGMQLLADTGEEGGKNKGLGWMAGNTRKLKVDENKFRIPHIGWNDVSVSDDVIFKEIKKPIFYFVHSYFLEPSDKNVIIAKTEYGEEFSSAVRRNNIWGVQFHPEKSQQAGLQLLENFLNT